MNWQDMKTSSSTSHLARQISGNQWKENKGHNRAADKQYAPCGTFLNRNPPTMASKYNKKNMAALTETSIPIRSIGLGIPSALRDMNERNCILTVLRRASIPESIK
jgi:hypothetical protein